LAAELHLLLMTGPRHQQETPMPASASGLATTKAGRRECLHPCAAHDHGTRAAYVADRCRCAACREANRLEAAARRRAQAYGRWRPFVAAAPARRHLRRLRAAGLGVDRIVELSGVGSGTIRQLIYGDPRTGRPVARIRVETAAAILAVPPARPAPGALVPAAATHALVADLQDAGYALADLARELGRTTSSLTGSLARARVRVATAAEVARLHRRLLECGPSAVTSTRRAGAGPLWCGGPVPTTSQTPTAGDVDGQFDVDEVAVERAMAGEPIELTLAGQIEAVRRLAARGMSVRRIALLLRTSARTVSRRKAAGAVA
jgi:hypothetical protein